MEFQARTNVKSQPTASRKDIEDMYLMGTPPDRTKRECDVATKSELEASGSTYPMCTHWHLLIADVIVSSETQERFVQCPFALRLGKGPKVNVTSQPKASYLMGFGQLMMYHVQRDTLALSSVDS